MLRFLKRAGDADDTLQKRPRTASDDAQVDNPDAPEPATFLTWNANSLPTRCKGSSDIKDFCRLIEQLEPDVIALQEVRMTAHAPDKAKKGDGQLRDRGRPRDNDKASKEEWQTVKALLDRPPFNRYQVLFSLADWRYAGTATLIKKQLRRPVKVEYNMESLQDKAGRSLHDENGRICLLHYPSGLAVLNTYAPNNGWREESFQRRREWDALVLRFVQRTRASGQPLVWLGDLNVAHREPDVTHPSFFRVQVDRTAPKPGPGDAGQPGFTPNEQARFGQLLVHGGLVDSYRHLHPADTPPPPDQPAWTWRGSHHQTDKYHNRGMRIDYALVSQQLVDRIAEVKIIGYGSDRTHFFGSDHCPLFLRLQPREQPGNLPAAAAAAASAAVHDDKAASAGAAVPGDGAVMQAGVGLQAGNQPQAQGQQQQGVEFQAAAGQLQAHGVKLLGSDMVIEHSLEHCQFIGRLPGEHGKASASPGGVDDSSGCAYLSYTICSKAGVQAMDIQHTFTPAQLRGQGLAARLCDAAVAHCRGAGLKVIASCSYVAERYVPSRPDLDDLLLQP